MFFCLKPNGTHSKRRDVILWRLPLTQTHAEFCCFTRESRNRQNLFRQKNRRTDLFPTQRRKGRKLYVLIFFCLNLMAHTANVETSYHGVSPTMLAPCGSNYFREHESHEFHESKFTQVNLHAGSDLLIAYEFSRILPCGQKNRMAFVLFVCD